MSASYSRAIFAVTCLLSFGSHGDAAPLTVSADNVNRAERTATARQRQSSAALITRAQVLLDRARYSPGEIDAKKGENFEKSLIAFAQANGLPATKDLTPELWSKLTATTVADAIVEYKITEDDVRGPFISKLPKKLEEMKDFDRLAYTSAAEALSEKFHMSEELLGRLNPGKTLAQAGEVILVANVAAVGDLAKVARLEVDKKAQTVRAYDRSEQLVAFYPATIGSDEKPSPSGSLKVTTIQQNPTYHYNPAYKFKGVKSSKPFVIKFGPNNPVGSVWIGLSQKGYGIHGTPNPSKVSKAESHGCIRLTNWDAQDLARRLSKGIMVVFHDGKRADRLSQPQKANGGAKKAPPKRGRV